MLEGMRLSMLRVVDVGLHEWLGSSRRDFLLMMGPANVVELLLFFFGEAPSIESAPGGGESRPE